MNSANYLATYGKILLGFATFVSVMSLVEELGRFNNPGVRTIDTSTKSSSKRKLAKQLSVMFAVTGAMVTIAIYISLQVYEFHV